MDAHIRCVHGALENSPYKDNAIAMFLTGHRLHLGEKSHRNVIVELFKKPAYTLRTLRERLIAVGARVVRHSRCVVFQMAAVGCVEGTLSANS